MKIALGYARVSTAGQSTDNQVDLLNKSGCSEVFIDQAVSGSRNHRSSEYRALMARVKELRADGIDVVVRVTKLDRFSRSTQHLLEGVGELGELSASFEALDGGFTFDAKSPMSVFMLTIFGALAQFERELIKSRMAEGREAVKAKGMPFGPTPALKQVEVEAIRTEFAKGLATDRQLATKWQVSRSTIQRVIGIYGHKTAYISKEQFEAAKLKARPKK